MSVERNKMPIYLVGMPGAGKTTVGRQLANRLGREFVDLDHEIEARTGVKIPLIFEYEGEIGFRDREAGLLAEISNIENTVIATGGGAVLRPENRRKMKSSGIVIYLSVRPETLFERTRSDRNRPLLQVADPLGKLRTLYVERDPLYREVATIVVNSSPNGGTQNVLRQLERELSERA